MSKYTIYKTLRILNAVIFSLICGLSLYLILMPFLPNLWFNFQTWRGTSVNANDGYRDMTATLPLSGSREVQFSSGVPDSEVNDFTIALNIPSIRMKSKIFSSTNSADLWKGIWHKQSSGNPVDGGNMVITAHRFLYTGNQNTFYHLPRMEPGQIVEMVWDSEVYLYRVSETFEVSPQAIEIEDDTEDHILTLYTCTPLWSNARRFVVRAEPLFE